MTAQQLLNMLGHGVAALQQIDLLVRKPTQTQVNMLMASTPLMLYCCDATAAAAQHIRMLL